MFYCNINTYWIRVEGYIKFNKDVTFTIHLLRTLHKENEPKKLKT